MDQVFSSFKKVLLLYLALLFFTSLLIIPYSQALPIVGNDHFDGGRRLLELEIEDKPLKKNSSKLAKSVATGTPAFKSTKNQTKLISTPASESTKNKTKLVKSVTTGTSAFQSTKNNKTKLIKPASGSTKQGDPNLKNQLNKLNSTSKTNSTKSSTSLLTKKSSSDLNLHKNKTSSNPTKTQQENNQIKNKNNKIQSKEQKPSSQKNTKRPSWIDFDDDDDDLVSEFRDLPSKFQETFLPDLDKISKTSQIYLTKYNKEITKGVKPYFGNKYAHTIASFVSFAFIIIPLIIVSLIFNRITAYFSLQKLIIFIQVYLSIYFSILCLSSLVTGLEPLKFFYATSQSTYLCLQVLQTLAYVLYLLLLLMYLVLVFSTETGLFSKLLGLGQTFVGFAVGLHYYMKVFHRAVLRQPPKTSWKVHALYAACFLIVCLLSRADRRKKAYLEEGGEEGKKS